MKGTDQLTGRIRVAGLVMILKFKEVKRRPFQIENKD